MVAKNITPCSPLPMGVFRIGLSVVLLYQFVCIAPASSTLFDVSGVYRHELLVSLDAMVPRAFSLEPYVRPLNATGLCLGVYVAALMLLLLGVFSRSAAAAALLMHAYWTNNNPAACYGADSFARIGLFACVMFPVSDALAIRIFSQRSLGRPSATARWFVVYLRLVLCLVYCTSGVEKALGAEWWNGEAIHRALWHTGERTIAVSLIDAFPSLAAVAGWATLLIETGYPVFAWWKRSRLVWVLATVGMHAGIIAFLGLDVFGSVMILFNLAAWLTPTSIGVPRCDASVLVAYDRDCAVCRGFVAGLHRIAPRCFRTGRSVDRRLVGVDGLDLSRHMSLVVGERATHGEEAVATSLAIAFDSSWLVQFGRLNLSRWLYRAFARRRRRLGCRGECRRAID